MKPNFLLIALIYFLSACFGLNAKPPAKVAKAPALSQTQSNFYKNEGKRIIKDYYGKLSVLKGENINGSSGKEDSMTSEDKRSIIESTRNEYFRNSEVLIDKNISTIAQDKLNIDDYLKNIAFLSDEIDKIDCDEKNITISDVYYNDVNRFYYIIGSTDQVVIQNKNQQTKRRIDLYLNFDPVNKLELKIYNIQNHTDEVPDNSNLVQIVPDDQAEAPLHPDSKPYYHFDVTPGNASINIDGEAIFNDGRKIEARPGTHTVEVSSPNYNPLKFEVAVGDTGVQNVVRVLTPKHGYLAVSLKNDDPQEPDVYIDSNMVGNAPISNYQLYVGSHYIEIKGANNFYKSYNVTIADENITTLNVGSNSKAKWEEKKNDNVVTAPTNLSFQTFYNELAQYGQWVEDPKYGNVWVPSVDGNFRPYYTNGHWAMTDAGNTWVSDEPWGWACFHYGRWTYNTYYNWVWVPGYDWAPAWVTWRFGKEACGWAPLSPDLNVDVSNGCPDSWWVFVGPGNLYVSAGYSNYWRGPQYNADYIRQTTVISNITIDANSHTRYNYGPRAATIEKVTHNKVQVYNLYQTPSNRGTAVNGQTINLYKANLKSNNPYAAHPSYIVQGDKTIDRPQEISNAGRQSVFRQDIAAKRVQPQPFINRSQPGQSYPQRSANQPGQPRPSYSQSPVNQPGQPRPSYSQSPVNQPGQPRHLYPQQSVNQPHQPYPQRPVNQLGPHSQANPQRQPNQQQAGQPRQQPQQPSQRKVIAPTTQKQVPTKSHQ